MYGISGVSRDRALYEKAQKMTPAGTTPTMGYLRQEVVLQNNQTNYRFDFNPQTSQPRPTERPLSIKDAFIANQMRLGILVERKTKPGSGVVYPFPNAQQIEKAVAAAAIGGTVEDLECVFNAALKVQFDQEVLVDAMNTNRFRAVPTTAAAAGSSTMNEAHWRNGLVDVEPNFIISGTRRNEFTLTLPAFQVTPSIAATDAAFDVRVVLELYGFHIPGGAGLAKK